MTTNVKRGDVTLFGNVTLNVEMIAYKDAMIESVRASLFWNIISLLL